MQEKPSYEELEQKIQELEQAESERKITEIALLESEARQRELFVSNPHPMWIYDLESLVFLDVNNAAIAHYGYSRKEFLSMTIRDIRPAEDVPRLQDNVECVSEGLDKAGIWRHIRKDGSVIDVEINSHVLLFGQRRAELVLVHDITESKRTEEALRKSEEKYRSLIQKIQAAVVLHDIDTKIIASNLKAQELLGLTEDQMLGKKANAPDWKFLRVDGVRLADEEYPVNQVMTTRQPLRDLTVGIPRADRGDLIWVLVNADPVFDDSGEMQQVIVTFMDVTDRKRNEDAINAFFDQSLIMLYIADMEKNSLIRVNNEVVRITGRSEEDLVKTPFIEFIHPEDRESTMKVMADATDGKPITDFQNRHITADGEVRFFEWNAVPDMERKLLYAMARDITEQKKAEAERRKLQAQLGQAQKMEAIGTLAGGIAHEFNNILSAIMGFSEISLETVEKDTKLYENLWEVLRAGKRAKDLVKHILTFSRQTEQERRPVEAKLIVKESLNFLRASLPTTIEIRQDIQSDSMLLADPTHVHQILMNLCTNAGHAMLDKGGVLEVKLEDIELDADFTAGHPDMKPGAYLNLTVCDTGLGMPTQVLKRIFDPFFTTKEPGEGTGMGLSVVHGIVTSYGGAITAYSELGQGATFRVYLPIIEIHKKPEIGAEEPIPTGSERILFIDDEPAVADVSKQTLESLGYDVTTRTSSIEALELFKAQPDKFDLVITDMTMPHMTGVDLAAVLIRIRPEIPVILCTGYSATINEQQATAMGIRAFIMKPVVKREMATTIRRVLDQMVKNDSGSAARILIIDDEAQIRLILQQMLETEGYEVIAASNGKEGMRLYRENPTDLIITDIIMPEKEDIEMIMELKKEFSEVKIIAISGGGRSAPEDYLIMAKLLGAKFTFTKPFNHKELLDAVKEIVG